MLVKVRLTSGPVEDVTALRAARLLDGRQAEPEGEWSKAQIEAVLAAHDARQGRMMETLAKDGLLVDRRTAPPPQDLGTFGQYRYRNGVGFWE